MSVRIGVDIDGCLANFNDSYIDRIIETTGRNLFPARPFDIPCWYYPEHYGYSKEETRRTWSTITSDAKFWQYLPAYDWTMECLNKLNSLSVNGSDVYFITSRPGIKAKQQTEYWLRSHGYYGIPTVLICSEKGQAASALDLSCYIDDRDVNVIDVTSKRGKKTSVFLLNRSWNRDFQHAASLGIHRINSPLDMLD